jgi:hypothetical protein
MNQDTVQIVALCALAGLVGWYWGTISAARAADQANLRARVWELEREKRERDYAQAVKDGKVPPMPPYAPIPGGFSAVVGG